MTRKTGGLPMSYETRRYSFSKLSPAMLGVQNIGITITHPQHAAKSLLTTYSMSFILSGKGKYYIRGKEYELHAGEGFLIPPYELCLYESDKDEPWTYIFSTFSGSGDQALVRELGLGEEELSFSFEDKPAVRREVELMFQEAEQEHRDFLRVTAHFLLAVSALAKGKSEKSSPPSNAEYVRKAIDYIHYNYPYQLTVSDIADSIGIDRSYLHRIFKKATGTSPEKFLTAYRLQCAQDMLTRLDGTKLTDIAIGCGFYDAAHFSRVFRSVFNMSPGEYMKEKKI